MKPFQIVRKSNLLALTCTFIFLMVSSSVFAVKKYVVNTNDTGTGSLRDAIANSNNGDTVVIDVSGTLVLQSQINISTDLTIIGPGPIHFGIDGTNITAPLSVGFGVITGSNNVYFEGIKFFNFSREAISSGSAWTGVLKVYGCSFENNTATILNVDGGLFEVITSSFVNNALSSTACFIEAGATFMNCTFYNNSSNAVWVNNGNTEIVNCTFYENDGSTSSSTAIAVQNGILKLRNNIVFNDTQSDALIDLFGTGSINSLGGNITNDITTPGLPSGTDIESLSLNSGLSVGSMVTDGWGITYFPPAAGSAGIDIDQTAANLPLFDQRRVWRVMDGGAGAEYADAGAVEYSQFTVTQQGTGANTLDGVYSSIYSVGSFAGKAAFVFELTGTGPFSCPTNLAAYDLSADSTIVNGFSQNGSRVPGPGPTSASVTSALTPIEVMKGTGNASNGFELSGNATILAGVSVQDYTFSAGVVVRTNSFAPGQVVGCHIGVDWTGMNEAYNNTGVRVAEFYGGMIGAGNYLGHHYQTRRNVISTNRSVQVRVFSGETSIIKSNIIGLNATGMNRPTGSTPVAGDTGVYISYFSTSMGVLVGGQSFEDGNLIGDQGTGIELQSENAKVLNNFIGSDITGNASSAETQNTNGVQLSGFSCFYNLIGEANSGNVIVSNSEGININNASNNKIYGNKIGVGADGFTALANTFSGVRIDGTSATNNEIGAPSKGNIISANNDGIKLTNSSNHNIVRANLIGLAMDTMTIVGNLNGIFVNGASSNNKIGGCNLGEGNIIGGNSTTGILFEGAGADNDTVYGNFIGTTPSGLNVGNSYAGIQFTSAVNNIKIGDISAGCANEIAYNGLGVVTDGTGNSNIHITGNSFHDNTGIGIDLDGDGQNATGASGAAFDNDNAETPSLLSAIDCGGTVNLGIQLEVTESVVIEVFKAADGEEGDSLITQQTVSFVSGVTSYVPFGSLPAGTNVVVTATYDGGTGFKNTSEFSSPIAITTGSPPTVNIVGQDSICDGSSEVFSIATVAGATYNWYLFGGYDPFETVGVTDSNAVTIAAVPEPLSSTDSLIVEVNDGGCIARDTMALYQLFPPFVDRDSIANIETCGGTGGLFFATYSPNEPMILYYNSGSTYSATTDNTSDGWFSMTGLAPGTYVIDSIGNGICATLIGNTYTLSEPLPPTVNAGVDQTICDGSSATLSATASGGSGTYTYTWDNGGGSGQTVTVTPGSSTQYIATVTDVETVCEAEDTLQITVSPLPVADAGIDQTSCEASPTVTLNGSVTNATGGQWTSSGSGTFSPGSTTLNADYIPSAADILAGTVTLSLTTTGNGVCAAQSDQMILTINPTPSEGNPLITNVSCFGGTDGGIMIAPSGAYTFSWVGPNGFTSANQDISGIEAGNYTLTMTDAAGCVGTYSGTVTEPTSLPTFTTTQTNVTCNGGADGSFTVSPSGGTSPYEISTDGGTTFGAPSTAPSHTWSGYSASSHDIVIRDANGCLSTTSTVTITEPAALTYTLVKLDDTCSQSLGEIQFVPSGGTSPYQFSIDAGTSYSTSSTFSGLLNGGYSLMVQDANGCTTSTFTTLNDQSGVSVFVSNYSTQVSCFDSADGFIDVTTNNPFGGTVTYNWTYNLSPFSTLEDINGLLGGDYELIATDMGGCKDTLPVTITTPSQLFMTAVATDETCSGYADGTLDTISAFGGTLPYTLVWEELPGNTSVGTTAPLSGVAAGDYIGIVTDSYGCEARDTLTVGVGESYTPGVSITFVTACINNNSFDFQDTSGGPASGAGSHGWTFINGSPTTSTLPGPTGIVFGSVGQQEVRYEVTSNAGCIFYDTVYVDIADTATVALTPMDISCFGLTDGSVTATASGGVGPYQYSFDGNTPSAVNTISNLGAGTYSCYVVDVSSGCQSNVHYVGIAEPAEITFTATVSDATCGESNGSVTFQNVTGGAGTYSYSVDGSTYGINTVVDTLSPGSYTYYVMDGNGCTATQTSNAIGNVGTPVPQPTVLEGSPFLICNDGSGSYGELTVQSNAGTAGTFAWSLGTVGNVIGTNDTLWLDDGNIGNHYLFVVESNGACESPADSVLLDVTDNDAVNNTLVEFCLGSEVVLDISTSGTVFWQDTLGEVTNVNAATTTALPVSIPTVYEYEVTLGDCVFQDSVVLIEDPDCDQITVVNNAFSPDGDGVNDLFIIDANALLSNDNTVRIINRWGDLIREFQNYDNSTVAWDGTNNSGNQVPAGTYFYIVEIPNLGFKTTGWIQVVR